MEIAQAGEILRFLLDTNVISEVRKSRPHGGLIAWMRAHPDESYAIPSVAIFEVQIGIEKLRRQDRDRAETFDAWIENISAAKKILPLDAISAREAARMMSKQSPHLIGDAMIAAIAFTNGLTVATRNVEDFERFRVRVENPFEYKP